MNYEFDTIFTEFLVNITYLIFKVDCRNEFPTTFFGQVASDPFVEKVHGALDLLEGFFQCVCFLTDRIEIYKNERKKN